MYKYIVTVAAVLLMVVTAVSANTMLSYAQNGSNMTDDVKKLAPDGSATGLIAQGEKSFFVVCPEDFLTIKQCEILATQPTVVAVK